ncbi:MAG: peptidoglycan bridge formation glycyltransferase FemA/FemB family protein [Candidatus Bathyarchaeia archaeon]
MSGIATLVVVARQDILAVASSIVGLRGLLIEASDVRDATWDSFIASSSHPSVFQTSVWGQVVKSLGQEPYQVSVTDEKGKIVAAALLVRRRTNSVLTGLGLNRGLVSWGPVANGESSLRSVLGVIREEAWKRGLSEVQITNDVFDALAFLDSGFSPVETSLDHEIVVELGRSKEDLWNGLDKDCRSAVRKAERDGVEVFEGSSEEFYDLYLRTRERLNVKVTPKPFFKAIEDLMVKSGMATFLIARIGGQNVGAMIMLQFGGVAWYYEGASDEKFWIHRANNLLQWRAIELAVQRKLIMYNLTQATSPENKSDPAYGLYLFKSQFGGEVRRLSNFRFRTKKHEYIGRLLYALAN